MDELTESLRVLLEVMSGLRSGLEEPLARLTDDHRSRSPFAYLMEPAEPAEPRRD